jgi:molecular chaperone GrpE
MEEKSEVKHEKRHKEKKQLKLVEEYKETIQRLQAEFENYKKRVEKDIANYKEYANAELVKRLLPVLDSFELAIKNINSDGEKFKKGVELVYAQLYSALETEGLTPIKAVGEKFDPYKHEALMQQGSEEETVLEELQKGYMFKGAVIRHSKVKLGKKEAKC